MQCDPSIKAIIVRIDAQHAHSFIIEDIDDEHVLVNQKKHDELKALLKDVCFAPRPFISVRYLLTAFRHSKIRSESPKKAQKKTRLVHSTTYSLIFGNATSRQSCLLRK